MNTYVSRGLWFTLCVGGLWLAGTAAANAAEAPGGGAVSGDQAAVSATAPVTLSGNGISLVGDSSSSGSSTASPAPAPAVAVSPSSLGGVLTGDQAAASVTAPVSASGNAVSVVGDSSSTGSAAAPPTAQAGSGGATASGTPTAPAPSDQTVTAGGASAAQPAAAPGTPSIGSSLQAPVTAGGNAVSVVGDSSSSGATSAPGGGSGGATASSAAQPGTGRGLAALSGVQAPVSVSAPVTAGGNAVSVLGDSSTSRATTGGSGASPAATAGSSEGGILPALPLLPLLPGSVLSGISAPVAVGAPALVGGNAVSVLGDAGTSGAVTVPGGPAAPGSGAPVTGTPGYDGAATPPAGATDPANPAVVIVGGSGALAGAQAGFGGGPSLTSADPAVALAAGRLAATGYDGLGLGAVSALLVFLGVMTVLGGNRKHRLHNR